MSETEEPSSPPSPPAPQDPPDGGERRRGADRRRGSRPWGGPERRRQPERRRPGRVRRWVVRPFVWGLLFVALLLLGVLLFIESRYAHQRAADLVVARLGDVLNRKIQVGSVDYGFAPLSFELRDLVIAGPRPQDPPFAVVPFVRFQFSWRDLRQRVLRLEQIEAVGPRIYVRFNPDGTSNLPQLRQQPQRTRRFEVQVGRILVERGSVQLDEKRLPLDLEARGVWGRLIGRAERGGEGGNRLDAWLTVPEIRTTLPNARPYPYEILAAKGSFEPGRIHIASALMSGPDLRARVRGDYRWKGPDRRMGLDIQASGSAALANRLGYLQEPIAGPFTFQGRAELAGRDWRWSGTARSPRLAILRRELRGIEAGLEGDRQRVDAEVKRAGYAGGTVAGTVHVDLRPEAETAAGKPVDLDLDYRDLTLQTLVEDQFPGRDLPVVNEVAGRASGHLLYRFHHRQAIAGSGRVDVRLAGVRTEAGRLPLSGTATLAIDEGVVTSDDIRVTAPSQEATARGFVLDLETGTGRFAYRLASQDVGVLAPLLSEPGEAPFWLPTRGRGTAEGEATFDPDGPAATVTLDLRDVASPALEADTVAGSLAVSPRSVEDIQLAMTRTGDGHLTLAGRVPLEEAGGAPRPLTLAVDADSWPVAGLAYFLPEAVAEPGFLDGRVTGRLDLGGTAEDLNGRAQAEVTGLTVSGFAVGRAEARFAFAGQRITVEQGLIEAPAGDVLVLGSFDGADGALDFTFDAPSLSLAAEPFRDALGGNVTGDVAVGAVLGGTADRPRATVRIAGRELALAGRPLGEAGTAEVLADWDGRRLRAEGSLLGLVSFAGGGALDLERADLAFDVRSERLGTLAKLASPEVPDFTGSLLGAATLTAAYGSGDSGGVGTYRAALRLADLRLTYQGRTIANLEPVVAALTSQGIEIQSLYMGEPGTPSEFFVAGTVGLGGGGESVPLRLNLQSTVAATWLELVPGLADPELEVEGFLDVLATVRGTLADPVINGGAEVREARLALPGFPDDFERLRANLTFDRTAVSLRGTTEFGRGTLTVTGTAAVPDAPGGWAPDRYDLRVQAADVSLPLPEGFSTRGDADLTVKGTASSREIAGEVNLRRMLYLEPVETDLFRLALRALRQRERRQVPTEDGFLASTRLNVILIEGPDALRVRNNVADLRGDIDLVVQGTLASPGITGTVTLDPGGTLLYNDNEFVVEQGRLTFESPYILNPEIDLTARTEVRNYDILLTASGTLERFDLQYSSDEGLAYLDVLALLTGGPAEELDADRRLQVPGQEQETEIAPSRFLASQAANALSERVNTLFGFDRFRIDPVPTETGRVIGGGVQLTLGKRISRDLFVTYTVNPAQSDEYILRGEWQVGRDVVLIFTGNGRDETVAVDAQWERRF